jgi:hypothetical protein
MDVFDLHPREVTMSLFTWAYETHAAAGATYRLANRIPPKDEARAVTEQRKGILTIAAKLQLVQRNDLLDRFCVAWLRYRNIPLPEKDYGNRPDPMGLRNPSGPDAGVQASVRESEVQAGEVHDRSAATGAQPSGGNTE